MKPNLVEVVVVGGGQAGLGTAYHLAQAGLDFVVLERGRVGETWRTQRWDSFALNTPNWMNGLPGAPYEGPDPHGFMSQAELAASFEQYVDRFDLPVRTGMTVTGVHRANGDGGFVVTAESSEGEAESYQASAVVIASGTADSPRIPAISSEIPDRILQLHTGGYRAPGALPAGAVVVVGGGQSGAQIVEDLLRAGRTVYFAISSVARAPRRYRGRDFMEWWVDMHMFDLDVDAAEPAVLKAANPLVSGVGPLGHSVSYQQLAADGAHLMGRLEDVRDGVLITDDRVMEYVASADERSRQLKAGIDAYIGANGLEAPAAEPDRGDTPAGDDVEFLTSLDLGAEGVSTIIWSTGFAADFSWIDLPVVDAGRPLHDKGIGVVPGVYFVGFHWLAARKSGIVYGIDEDARRITNAILERAAIS